MSEDRADSECGEATPTNSFVDQSIEQDLPHDSSKKSSKDKLDIFLKPTGDAPIMKRKKWLVEADKTIGWIIQFVTKYLRLQPNERIFLYVNQTFAPAPDQTIRNLYECYCVEGKLILHYCKTQAWG